MRKYIFGFIFGIASIHASGCLNGDFLKLEDGTTLYQDYDGLIPHGHQFGGNQQLHDVLLSLEKGYRDTKNINYLSDKGLILILLGRYQEAINLYKNIENTEPDRYSTASNIGTAYELIGNNEKALYWIEKAVKIMPDSHFGSEWIHVNILKAKMKGDQYISSHFLINHDFGKEKAPTSILDKKQLNTLREQIYYQLNERITFVKPKDKIVAQLLFDLGNVSYLYGDKEDAMENYELAKEYGFDNPILKERMALYSVPVTRYIERKVKNEVKFQTEPIRRFHLLEILLSVFAFIFSCLIVFVFRKKILLLLK
nr:tetratricopeptide repeat protein [uncultured Chryseobacterium sp.]